MNVVFKAVQLSIAVFACSSAFAEWKVIADPDWLITNSKSVAVVENQEGDLFSIYRVYSGDQVWGTFRLSGTTSDQIASDRPPIYNVDGNIEYDLLTSKNMDELYDLNMYHWAPEQVDFVIWHGHEDEGVVGDIVDMVKGDKILFKYYTVTGESKQIFFTLKGSASAISKAVGIDMKKAIEASKKKM